MLFKRQPCIVYSRSLSLIITAALIAKVEELSKNAPLLPCLYSPALPWLLNTSTLNHCFCLSDGD